MGDRAKDWLAQAQNDFAFAVSALERGFYSQCCFICQQSAEKALKSALFARGADVAFTHSLVRLCAELGINGDLKRAAARLDQYYLSSRYPDALPAGAPFELFDEAQAREAVAMARALVQAVGGQTS